MPLLFSRRANRATAKDGAGSTADLSDRMAQALRMGSARLGDNPATENESEQSAAEAATVASETQDGAQAAHEEEVVEDDAECDAADGEPHEASEHRPDSEMLPRFLSVSDQARGPNIIRHAVDYLKYKIEAARDRISSWELDALDSRALALSAIAAFVSVLAFGGLLSRLDDNKPRALKEWYPGKLSEPSARPVSPPNNAQAACETGDCDQTNLTIGLQKESSPEFRLAFADRLPSVYLSAAMAVSMEAVPQKAEPEAADAIGRLRIRNLPPDTQLSAGTKVGSGEWEISGSDVNNLIVTLPRRALAPVNAEIALMRPDGTQAGQVAVAIVQGAAHAEARTEAIPVKKRPAAKSRPKPKQVAVVPKAPEPDAATPPVEQTAEPPPLFEALLPPAPEAPPPAPEAPAAPVAGLFNGTFLFLPGPMGLGAQPDADTTAGTDTLINLGVMPR